MLNLEQFEDVIGFKVCEKAAIALCGAFPDGYPEIPTPKDFERAINCGLGRWLSYVYERTGLEGFRPVLENAVVDGVYIEYGILSRMKVSSTRIKDSLFWGSDFNHTEFLGVRGFNCQFNGSTLVRASFKKCKFYHCVFSDALFVSASLDGVEFRFCEFYRTNFMDVFLRDVRFYDCVITDMRYEPVSADEVKFYRSIGFPKI